MGDGSQGSPRIIKQGVEGIYTNCRKPVVQKEGINYYGTSSLALIAESIFASFIYKNKRVLDFIPRKFPFFPAFSESVSQSR